MGKHQRLRAWLLEAGTVQEFLVRLGEAADQCGVGSDEACLLRTVRNALGDVMNKTTATWIPCTVENMHKVLGTTPAANDLEAKP